MAIRLASAIGQQREPIGILGDLDNAVNKTGDAIQADLERKAAEAAKKKEQEQRLKDAFAANFKVEPLEKAVPEENKEYENYAKEKSAEIFVASQDPRITPSQLKKMQDDVKYGLEERRIKYAETYDTLNDVASKLDTHDTALFDNFMIGKTNPTQVANMPNDDFMAASEADRAGKMPQDNMPQYGSGNIESQDRMILTPSGEKVSVERINKNPSGDVEKMREMKATKTETSYQGTPYLNLPFEEKKKINFRGKADELVALKQPEITKAAQGYFGNDFKFDSYTKRTDKVSPTTGEYIFEFDEKQADLDAKKFASSMVGKGSFGDKNHAQMQRALEYEALRAGNEAGFSGERLSNFVEEVVPKMAYDKFMADAKAAEVARMKNDKDITKAPSKGLNITFNGNGNGGGSNKYWNVEKGETRDLNKAKDGVATKDKLGKYTEYTFESIATPENAKVLNLGGYNNVVMKAAEINNETGDVEFIRVVVPKEAASQSNGYKEQAGGTRMVKVTKDDVNSLRTNLGDELYDKTIGSFKKATKAAPKKELTWAERQAAKNKK